MLTAVFFIPFSCLEIFQGKILSGTVPRFPAAESSRKAGLRFPCVEPSVFLCLSFPSHRTGYRCRLSWNGISFFHRGNILPCPSFPFSFQSLCRYGEHPRRLPRAVCPAALFYIEPRSSGIFPPRNPRTPSQLCRKWRRACSLVFHQEGR